MIQDSLRTGHTGTRCHFDLQKKQQNRLGLPNLGYGVGLRSQHFPYLMQQEDVLVDWFEIISENFIGNYGYGRHVVKTMAEKKPLVMHGVSMNIGSSGALDTEYLKQLKELAQYLQPKWISDHLCWTGLLHVNTHDLLPIPLTEESLQYMIERVRTVQDYMERPLVIENPSTYLEFSQNTITEWDFLRLLALETGCGLLLDVNNVFVSAFNHGYDAEHYIRQLPHEHIVQIHIAGPTHCGDYMIDTHDQPVPTPVWHLYQLAQSLTGGVSTLLEWDANIPEYPTLVEELFKAKHILNGGFFPTEQLKKTKKALSTPLSSPHYNSIENERTA